MTDQIWSLDLAGKGAVTAPDGTRQELRYHKVAEFLAMLAENSGQMYDREALGRALWPEAARAERLVNIRQSLFQARLVLGENLQTTRTACWLTCGLEVFNESGSAGGLVQGRNTKPESRQMKFDPLPTASTLELFAHDPEQGLRLSPAELRQLVMGWKAIDGLEEWREWIQFWEAMSDFAERVTGPNLQMEKLQVFALGSGDARMLAQTTFWGGASAIASGQYKRAEVICTRVRRTAFMHDGDVQRALGSVEAHLLLHQGNGEVALRRLANLEWPDALSQRRNDGLLGLYLAIEGQYREAERLLLAKSLQGGAMDASGDVPARDLALAFIDTADLRSGSFSRAEDVADRYQATRNHHLELYTRELLWRRAKERSRLAMAQRHVSRIKSLRRSIGLAFTEWDRLRLTPSL